MHEDIGKLISEGFGIWRRNMNICIPFLLATTLTLAAIIPFVAGVAALYGSMPEIGSNSSPSEVISKIGGYLPGLGLAALLFVLAVSLINSFFACGAIGMAEQAIQEAKTSTKAMWSAGKRHFLDMFAASILVGLLMLAGLIFLVPGILSLPLGSLSNLAENPQSAGILALGALMLIMYLLVVSLFMAVVPYALVVDILGPINAIKASIRFFNYNKFDVFVMWLIIIAISLGMQMLSSSAAAAGIEIQATLSIITSALNVAVVAPLATVWWTWLYMSRTGKKVYLEGTQDVFDEPK
jgi:hypothetical protein